MAAQPKGTAYLLQQGLCLAALLTVGTETPLQHCTQLLHVHHAQLPIWLLGWVLQIKPVYNTLWAPAGLTETQS
jgi:hypothetical protein